MPNTTFMHRVPCHACGTFDVPTSSNISINMPKNTHTNAHRKINTSHTHTRMALINFLCYGTQSISMFVGIIYWSDGFDHEARGFRVNTARIPCAAHLHTYAHHVRLHGVHMYTARVDGIEQLFFKKMCVCKS